jgi:hypothetical protein
MSLLRIIKDFGLQTTKVTGPKHYDMPIPASDFSRRKISLLPVHNLSYYSSYTIVILSCESGTCTGALSHQAHHSIWLKNENWEACSQAAGLWYASVGIMHACCAGGWHPSSGGAYARKAAKLPQHRLQRLLITPCASSEVKVCMHATSTCFSFQLPLLTCPSVSVG